MTSGKNVIELCNADFDSQVIDSDLPVLVDFTATWCGPCKMITPFLEELAIEYKDKLKIAKIDVDQNADTAARYSVRAMPTLILFNKGEQKEIIVGADPRKIRDMVEKQI